jgi:hypothetical protein
MMPGVPAAGHVTGGGAWHPGQADGCAKCELPRGPVTVARADDGWVSARGGKWHRATVAEPVFTRDEHTRCGLRFRPLNVTWHGERPPTTAAYLCRRRGCAE